MRGTELAFGGQDRPLGEIADQTLDRDAQTLGLAPGACPRLQTTPVEHLTLHSSPADTVHETPILAEHAWADSSTVGGRIAAHAAALIGAGGHPRPVVPTDLN